MDSPEVLELLELAYTHLKSGLIAQSLDVFSQILAKNPHQAYALNGLGCCAESKGHLLQAEDYYRQALKQMPQEQEFLSNLAVCLQQQKRGVESLEIFESIIDYYPSAESYYNLALAQYQNALAWPCLYSLRFLLKLDPTFSQGVGLLTQLIAKRLFDTEAYDQFKRLLMQHSEDAFYHLCLGLFYYAHLERKVAARYFRAALYWNPRLSGAYQLLIYSLQTNGEYAQSLDIARRLMDYLSTPLSLLDLISSMQKPIPSSQAESEQIRGELEQLFSENMDVCSSINIPLLSMNIPFYPVYQHGNDRVLQEKMACFFSHLVKKIPPKRHAEKRLRLGVISQHLFKHSVMDLLYRALMTVIGSACFETYVFTLRQFSKEDELTQALHDTADHFIYLPDERDLAIAKLASCSLDILIYPDIGMESFNYLLALHKPARYQMVLPGHPVTTGMPTMDYFISGETLETPNSDLLFTEALIRLPGLPDYEKPIAPPYVSALELGLPEGRLYFCPMTTFKLQPSFDLVLDAILKADPKAQILLLSFKNDLHLKLKQRLDHTVLDSERIHFLSWSPKKIFYQRLMAVDVILDSFYFGGGNTTYQAFGLGCPIVTLDQPWNKGRWTQAMYKMMGIEGLIAKDRQDYVAIALRLARDKDWQTQKRTEIKAKSPILFDNPTWSEALLDFCKSLR